MKVLAVEAPGGVPDGVRDYQENLLRALEGGGDTVQRHRLEAWPSPRSLRKLRRLAREADVVHVQYPLEGWAHSPAPAALLPVALAGVAAPLVVTLHEYPDLHRLRKLNILPLLAASDGVVCSSGLVAKGLSRWAGPSRPCQVIPIGSNLQGGPIDWERARRLRDGWLGGAPGVVLGFFGSLYRGKRPEFLVAIAKELQGRGARAQLVYAGSVNPDQASLPDEIQGLARSAQVAPPVFTGYLGDADEVRHTLAAFDAAVQMYHDGPSLRRGSMLACLEAGSQVVVSDGPGLEEVAGSAWGAQALRSRQLLVLPDDAGAVADALLQGGAWAPDRFEVARTVTWDEVARLHRAFYASLRA